MIPSSEHYEANSEHYEQNCELSSQLLERKPDSIRNYKLITVGFLDFAYGKIYYGIKTGFNKAFVIDGNKRAKLIAQDPKSAELIKPLAVGDDVRKWRINSQDKWLIFTRRGIDINAYPAIKAHLAQWQQELTPKRNSQQSIGRKPGSYKWYEIQDNVDYFNEFEKPKIVFPEICKEQRFSLDGKNLFWNNKAFIIPLADFYLLGVLNSAIAWEYTKSICAALGDENKGGRLMLQWVNFQRLPIPDASTSEREAISKLVQKCLDAKGTNCSQWEKEIDERVATLYGL